MPRVVRDMIWIRRTTRPPVREPPGDSSTQTVNDPQSTMPIENKCPEVVEWQCLIVIHLIADTT